MFGINFVRFGHFLLKINISSKVIIPRRVAELLKKKGYIESAEEYNAEVLFILSTSFFPFAMSLTPLTSMTKTTREPSCPCLIADRVWHLREAKHQLKFRTTPNINLSRIHLLQVMLSIEQPWSFNLDLFEKEKTQSEPGDRCCQATLANEHGQMKWGGSRGS